MVLCVSVECLDTLCWLFVGWFGASAASYTAQERIRTFVEDHDITRNIMQSTSAFNVEK